MASSVVQNEATQEPFIAFSQDGLLPSRSQQSLNQQGIILLQQGRIEDAIFVFNEASKRGSENAEILCNLAYAYYQHEDIEKAIPYLNRALNLKPKRGSSLLLAGQIFAKLGEQQKAISYFESYLYYSSNRKAAVEQLIQWSNGFEDGRNLVLRESAKQALMNAGYNNLE